MGGAYYGEDVVPADPTQDKRIRRRRNDPIFANPGQARRYAMAQAFVNSPEIKEFLGPLTFYIATGLRTENTIFIKDDCTYRSFHFEHTFVTKGLGEGTKKAKNCASIATGQAAGYQAYISRPDAQIGLQPTDPSDKSLRGRQQSNVGAGIPSLTATESVQVNSQRRSSAAPAESYYHRDEAPVVDENGVIEYGNIGSTVEERIQFWRDLEDALPKRSRVQNRIIADLPVELKNHPKRMREVIEEFLNFLASIGLAGHAVVHKPNPAAGHSQDNYHFHLAYTRIRVAKRADGQWDFAVAESYLRRGKTKVRRPYLGRVPDVVDDRYEWIPTLRKHYCDIVNRHMKELRTRKFYFHETYAKAGFDCIPELHLGPREAALARSGRPTETAVQNLTIQLANTVRFFDRRMENAENGAIEFTTQYRPRLAGTDPENSDVRRLSVALDDLVKAARRQKEATFQRELIRALYKIRSSVIVNLGIELDTVFTTADELPTAIQAAGSELIRKAMVKRGQRVSKRLKELRQILEIDGDDRKDRELHNLLMDATAAQNQSTIEVEKLKELVVYAAGLLNRSFQAKSLERRNSEITLPKVTLPKVSPSIEIQHPPIPLPAAARGHLSPISHEVEAIKTAPKAVSETRTMGPEGSDYRASAANSLSRPGPATLLKTVAPTKTPVVVGPQASVPNSPSQPSPAVLPQTAALAKTAAVVSSQARVPNSPSQPSPAALPPNAAPANGPAISNHPAAIAKVSRITPSASGGAVPQPAQIGAQRSGQEEKKPIPDSVAIAAEKGAPVELRPINHPKFTWHFEAYKGTEGGWLVAFELQSDCTYAMWAGRAGAGLQRVPIAPFTGNVLEAFAPKSQSGFEHPILYVLPKPEPVRDAVRPNPSNGRLGDLDKSQGR